MMESVEVEEPQQIVGHSLVLDLHMWAHHVHTFDHGQLKTKQKTSHFTAVNMLFKVFVVFLGVELGKVTK